jgi:major membrane immunogen (membrane-anchored lipoprotein)
MKKTLILLIAIIMMVSVFAGCSKDQPAEEPTAAATEEAAEATDAPSEETGDAMYEDGVYFARDEISATWTYFVVVTVEGGKISDAYWGGTNFVPQGDKRVLSENAQYGMVAYGGAQSYWYEQAEAAEAWLLENQDPTAFEEFYTDEEGHTDSLTTDGGATVSVHVLEFFTLAAEALASDPVPAGEFGDTPVVTAKGEPSDNGWQELAEFIVVNGTIVAVDFDALYTKELVTEGEDANVQYFAIDGDDATAQSKDQLKEDYGMKANGGSELEWYEQAELLEAYVLENQDIYALTDEGYADGVTGVSVHANGFVELFNEAFGK